MRYLRLVVILALAGAAASSQADIRIDPDFSAGGSTGPLPLPVSYTFMTSWDGIEWTPGQKDSTREAMSYLNSLFVTQPAIVELPEPAGGQTIRWGGDDFFKDQGTWTLNGHDISMDLTGAIGVALKKGLKPPPGWDELRYPLNEIYLNVGYKWHFDPLTDPPSDRLDYRSVVLHEKIHMLCVNDHTKSPSDIMFESIGYGQRKLMLTESDKQKLREAGYDIVPAPGTLCLLALSCVVALQSRQRRG